MQPITPMNPVPTLHPVIVPSGQTPAIHAFGEEVVFHLSAEHGIHFAV